MLGKDLDRRVQDAVARYEAPEVAAFQAQVRIGLVRQDGAGVQYGNGATRSAQIWAHCVEESQTHGCPPAFLLPFAMSYRDRTLPQHGIGKVVCGRVL
jgi:hypothetical protein